jgi:hypothetical protein
MDKLESYTPQITEIICRRCQSIIGQVLDNQCVQSGGMQIYNSFRPICAKCLKPSAHWYPELEIEEQQYQSRLDFQKEILRNLAAESKFKK